ncbi:MAG: hypothetical protein HY914_07090 [Desulfomonile tiedjei]|nr:hypothetical protein [Desulfomonile tiedjei]
MRGASSQRSGGGMYAATGRATRTAVPTSAIITRRSDERNLELLTGFPFGYRVVSIIKVVQRSMPVTYRMA